MGEMPQLRDENDPDKGLEPPNSRFDKGSGNAISEYSCMFKPQEYPPSESLGKFTELSSQENTEFYSIQKGECKDLFDNVTFCLNLMRSQESHESLKETIESRGGRVTDDLTPDTDMLLVEYDAKSSFYIMQGNSSANFTPTDKKIISNAMTNNVAVVIDTYVMQCILMDELIPINGFELMPSNKARMIADDGSPISYDDGSPHGINYLEDFSEKNMRLSNRPTPSLRLFSRFNPAASDIESSDDEANRVPKLHPFNFSLRSRKKGRLHTDMYNRRSSSKGLSTNLLYGSYRAMLNYYYFSRLHKANFHQNTATQDKVDNERFGFFSNYYSQLRSSYSSASIKGKASSAEIPYYYNKIQNEDSTSGCNFSHKIRYLEEHPPPKTSTQNSPSDTILQDVEPFEDYEYPFAMDDYPGPVQDNLSGSDNQENYKTSDAQSSQVEPINKKERFEWVKMFSSIMSGNLVRLQGSRLANSTTGTTKPNLGYQIWIEIRANLHGFSKMEELKMLKMHRIKMDTVIEEVCSFCAVKSTEFPPRDQISDLLDKVSYMMSLYPSINALQKERPSFGSTQFQKRLDAITAWTTLDHIVGRCVHLIKTWTDSSTWPVKKIERLLNVNRSAELSEIESYLKEAPSVGEFQYRIVNTLKKIVLKSKSIISDHSKMFNKLNIGVDFKQLNKIVSFSSNMAIDMLKAKLKLSEIVSRYGSSIIDQLIEDYSDDIKLFMQIKDVCSEFDIPTEGWLVNSSLNPLFGSTILRFVKGYFSLMRLKLSDVSEHVLFKEAEMIEGKWQFMLMVKDKLQCTDREVAIQFCKVASGLLKKLHIHINYYIRDNPQNLADILAQNESLSKFYSRAIDNVKNRARKLFELFKMLSVEFENCSEYMITGSTRILFDRLALTKHILVQTNLDTSTNILIFASFALLNNPPKIVKLLKSCPRKYNEINDNDNYIIIVNFKRPYTGFKWKGVIVKIYISSKSFKSIQITENTLKLVVDNTIYLQNCRQKLESIAGDILVNVTPRDSHIASISNEFAVVKECFLRLTTAICVLVESVKRTLLNDINSNPDSQCNSNLEVIQEAYIFASGFSSRMLKYFSKDKTNRKFQGGLLDFCLSWLEFCSKIREISPQTVSNQDLYNWSLVALNFTLKDIENYNITSINDKDFTIMKRVVASCLSNMFSECRDIVKLVLSKKASIEYNTSDSSDVVIYGTDLEQVSRTYTKADESQIMETFVNLDKIPVNSNKSKVNPNALKNNIHLPSIDKVKQDSAASSKETDSAFQSTDANSSLETNKTIAAESLTTSDNKRPLDKIVSTKQISHNDTDFKRGAIHTDNSIHLKHQSEHTILSPHYFNQGHKCISMSRRLYFGIENLYTLQKRNKWRQGIRELDEKISAKQISAKLVGKMLDNTNSEDKNISLIARNSLIISLRWKQGKYIGSGSFGDVYMCTNLETGDIMAVKEVKFFGANNLEKLSKFIVEEMNVLQMLQHPNIIEYYGVEVHRDRLCIFMEYSKYSLAKVLEKTRFEDENILKIYTKHLLRGLEYLHSNGIIHRDIKPANLLIGNEGRIKYVDFGASKMFKTDEALLGYSGGTKTLVGTPQYIAPEVITNEPNHKRYSRDVWALGCCVLEMFTGKQPWGSIDNDWAIIWLIGTGNEHPEIPKYPKLSNAAINFLEKCFTRPARERPSAAELMSHPWIKDVEDECPDISYIECFLNDK